MGVVERAAKHLDEVRPGWYKLVKPHQIDLSSDRDCVIGQIDGSFIVDPSNLVRFRDVRAYFKQLTPWCRDRWITAIEARHNIDRVRKERTRQKLTEHPLVFPDEWVRPNRIKMDRY